MDFTDIKYGTTGAAKLKNSSSMDSSETVHSPPNGQYDEDDFETTSTTHGTNDVNSHSDTIESVDDLTIIGDYNYEKYQSYSDQRTVDVIDEKTNNNDDVVNEIEKLRKNVHDELTENESFLDKFCENLSKDVKLVAKDGKREAKVEKVRFPIRPVVKGKEVAAKKVGRVSSGTTKKKSLDPTKKTELLAQLKAIDKSE